MRTYEPNEVIREVAAKIKEWGVSGNQYGVRQCGGHFEYWSEINRRGQFKLRSGAVVVLDPAELTIALNLASDMPPEEPRYTLEEWKRMGGLK